MRKPPLRESRRATTTTTTQGMRHAPRGTTLLRAIAATLFMACRTAEEHVTRIMRKLGVASRAEITAAHAG